MDEGTKVTFDFYADGKIAGQGIIRGKASNGFPVVWIVEVVGESGIDKETYPWSCITVQESLLKVES